MSMTNEEADRFNEFVNMILEKTDRISEKVDNLNNSINKGLDHDTYDRTLLAWSAMEYARNYN